MKRVLLIDDAKITINMLTDILLSNGYDVCGIAENGEEGFEKYKELNPDIAIIDITMPQVDGIKGIELIKTYDKNAKIIVCSAIGQKHIVLKAIKAGAAECILKPFDEKKVINSIRKVLNQ